MNPIKKPLGILRIVLLVLTLATIAMAFLPLMEVEKSVWLGFDSQEDQPEPTVTVKMIEGAWFMAVCSIVRSLLVIMKKPAADAVSAILAIIHSGWIWFVPFAHEIIRAIIADTRTFVYDPAMDFSYVYAYKLAPLAWLLIGVNALCVLLTVIAMVKDKNAS